MPRTFTTGSGSGSDATKKVGVGSTTDIQWFNVQYPFFLNTNIAATDSESVWDLGAATANNPSIVDVQAQEYITGQTAGDYAGMFPDLSGVVSDLRFNSGIQVIFQCVIQTDTAGAQNLGGIGFEVFGSASIRSDQGSTADVSIGFVRADAGGQWFTHVCDTVAVTENAIVLADNTAYTLRCEYDPGNVTPQVRFYVDGTLVDTITTNLPTAVNSNIGFGGGNGGGAGDQAMTKITCPSFAVEI